MGDDDNAARRPQAAAQQTEDRQDGPSARAAAALHVRPFPAGQAGLVSRWAGTADEVLMWCGLTAAPVPAGQIEAWADEDGVQPFGLYRDDQLAGYGELWVDDDEAEVELARLIVDPRERGRGLGRHLVTELAGRARSVYPLVFLRVHPANQAAQRCYTAAGFRPVTPEQAAEWNTGQPVAYRWFTLAT